MVVARGLHKWYGNVHAVRGVGFSLKAGEVVGVLGHNGAGKSTTIRMLTGYVTPDVGSVEIQGHDIIEDRVAATRTLGYLPEATPLYPEMPAADYIAYRAKVCAPHLSSSERKARVREVMDRCWLTEMKNRRVSALSKGYKQRVGLAAALVHDPSVLILDEPTSGLDPTQVRETRELIRGLSHKRTVLISSHILPEVEQLCTRVIIFAAGQVRADGSLKDLLRNAGGGYIVETRAMLPDQKNRLFERWRAIPGFEQIRSGTIDDRDAADVARSQAGEWHTWKLDFTLPAPRQSVLHSPGDRSAGSAGFMHDPREAIARAMIDAGVSFRELRTQSATLEQVFLQAQEGAPVKPGSEELAAKQVTTSGGTA